MAMNHKHLLLTLTIILSVSNPCYTACSVTGDTVEDYLNIAKLYESNHQHKQALNYINMIEPYDSYNPKIIYQKAYILKKLNKLTQVEKTLKELISLNKDYACSPVAQELDEYNGNKGLCCGR